MPSQSSIAQNRILFTWNLTKDGKKEWFEHKFQNISLKKITTILFLLLPDLYFNLHFVPLFLYRKTINLALMSTEGETAS